MKAVRALFYAGLLTAVFAGCSGGSGGSTPVVSATATPAVTASPSPTPSPTPSPVPQSIYVSDNASLKGFYVTDSGTAAPEYNLTTATYSSTAAFDSAGRIYDSYQNDSISVFAAGASGAATPTATIGGSNSAIGRLWTVRVDASGKIYADDYNTNRIVVFAAGASGNATPIATIAGPATLLDQPAGMALDASGNLFVVSSSTYQILEFAAGASGNVAPIAVLQTNGQALAVAIDRSGRIIVGNQNGSGVTVYAAGATGSATPVATINGSNTDLNSEYSVAVDAGGNIWVGDKNSSSGTNHEPAHAVLEFASSATGNVAPLRSLTAIGGTPYDLVVR